MLTLTDAVVIALFVLALVCAGATWLYRRNEEP